MAFRFDRDVTDHLQLLLRKSGYNLSTSAEREVVRIIKEKTCYVALNPTKEEKEAAGGGRGEEYRLPDGNLVRVRPGSVCSLSSVAADLSWISSSGQNGSAHQRSFSIPNLSAKNIPVSIKSSSTLSIVPTSISAKASSPMSSLVVEAL
jgi:hypothetical protein